MLKYLFFSGSLSIRLVWLCHCLSFHLFPVKLKGVQLFHHITCDHCSGYWNRFSNHLKDLPREDMFINMDAYPACNKFSKCVQVVIKIKLQVFSQALFISMVFSFLYCWLSPLKSFFSYVPTGKFCAPKIKLWWISSPYKRVLESVKPVYATKGRGSTALPKDDSCSFQGIANSVFSKGRSDSSYLMVLRSSLLHLIKQSC